MKAAADKECEEVGVETLVGVKWKDVWGKSVCPKHNNPRRVRSQYPELAEDAGANEKGVLHGRGRVELGD